MQVLRGCHLDGRRMFARENDRALCWTAGARRAMIRLAASTMGRGAVAVTVVGLSFLLPTRSAATMALTAAFSLHAAPPANESEIEAIETLINSGKLQEAREKLRKEAAARGESYQTLFLEAKILFREQRYRESLKVLERCLALDQQEPELYKLVASNAILISRLDIAEPALKSAIRLVPEDYLAHFHLGALYYTDSRFPQAEPELRKVVKLNPEFVPGHLFLGLTLEELGDEQTAIQCYRQGIEITERQKLKEELPYLYLGRLLYRQNHYPESLPYIEKAVQVNPQSCEGLCLLAKILTTTGRDTEALAALGRCVRADPRYSEPHYLLSRMYVKQGNDVEAQRELQMFLELKKVEKKKADPRRRQTENR